MQFRALKLAFEAKKKKQLKMLLGDKKFALRIRLIRL